MIWTPERPDPILPRKGGLCSMLPQRGMMGASGGGELPFPEPANLVYYFRADAGVTDDPPVSAWQSTRGSGSCTLTASASLRPAYSATGGPNDTPMVSFDGNATRLRASGLASVARPYHVFMVHRLDAHQQYDYCWCQKGSDSMGTRHKSASPEVGLSSGDAGSNEVSLTLGTWFVVESYYDHTANNFQRLDNGTKVTGETNSFSTNNVTSLTLGADDNGTAAFSDSNIAEWFMVAGGEVTGSELANIMAYFTSRYGIP